MSASLRKVLAVEVAGQEKDAAYTFMLWRLVCSLLLALSRMDGQIFSYYRDLLYVVGLLMVRGAQVV
jgi:hypothetical protein